MSIQHLRNLKVFTVSVLAVLMFIVSAAAQAQEGKTDHVPFRIDINALRSHSDVALKVVLSNKTTTLYQLRTAFLPWGIQNSLLLVAMVSSPISERIPEALYVDDPGPGNTPISPGQQLNGTIDLVHRFPTLLTYLKDNDVIIFWSYRPVLRSGVALDPINGAVTIHKS